MRQLGAVLSIFALLTPVLLAGCSDDTQEVSPTGIRLEFTECLSFGVWIFIEGEYQGMASTEEFYALNLAAGTYEIYLRGNAMLGDTYYCWGPETVTVTDGNMTMKSYSCDGAECQD